ncbi:hypothetical protein [Umezawaea sp. NPDC059074]|uniref:hypothetical protein n=1 Tax=Umezawaea sp. NPDC059074 TaxID=3346716 RepID=UPI0036CD1030
MSTYAENRRADRAAQAEQRRADLAAKTEADLKARQVERDARRADQVMLIEQRRATQAADAQRVQAEKAAARDRRARASRAVAGWVSAHTLDLLFVPVILVPAVLAWSAISGYGHDLYGTPGWTLPLYSEAAMWAFAFAVAAARRGYRPVARLLLGLWVSAAVSATLAFLHGLTATGGSVTDGVVMAVVAVGGVIVHQIVDTASTAGPRRTREQRAADRLHRLAVKRVDAVRRAAVRTAVADLAADGTATLLHRPGVVGLRRRPWGRARLVAVTVPGLPVAPLPEVDAVVDSLTDEISAYLSTLPTVEPIPPAGNDLDPSGNAETSDPLLLVELAGLPADTADKVPGYVSRVRAAIDSGRLPAAPSQTAVRKFLRIRSEVAAVVHRVLTHSGPDGPTPVTA